MPPTSTASRNTFTDPSHFTKIPGVKKWYCNACASADRPHIMSRAAAVQHEKTTGHVEKVRGYTAWLAEPELAGWGSGGTADTPWSLRELQRRKHVDALKDLIPFWQQQVEAASRGVELRWETILSAIEQQEQRLNWPVSGWGMEIAEPRSTWSESAKQSTGRGWGEVGDLWGDGKSPDSGTGADDPEAYAFVEKIASTKSVTDERRREMHEFYKIPTQEKVLRIQELVQSLHLNLL